MPSIITLADLQTITYLNSQVEARKVAPAIEDAHEACEKVLGRTGYALVYATHASYTALLAYVKPWMAWYAMERAYPDLYAEADKGGVFKKSGEDYASVGGSDLSMKISTARSRAENKLERLQEYLEANIATYTWYGTNVDGEERIDETTKAVAGISFHRSTQQDRYRG